MGKCERMKKLWICCLFTLISCYCIDLNVALQEAVDILKVSSESCRVEVQDGAVEFCKGINSFSISIFMLAFKLLKMLKNYIFFSWPCI